MATANERRPRVEGFLVRPKSEASVVPAGPRAPATSPAGEGASSGGGSSLRSALLEAKGASARSGVATSIPSFSPPGPPGGGFRKTAAATPAPSSAPSPHSPVPFLPGPLPTSPSPVALPPTPGPPRPAPEFVRAATGSNLTVGAADLVRDVSESLSSSTPPEPSAEGLGGTYFLRGPDGRRRGILKPEDEEPLAPNNPKGFVGRKLGDPGFKPTVRVGEAAAREVAAYLLDHGGFARVPHTAMVHARHPVLHVAGRGKGAGGGRGDGEPGSPSPPPSPPIKTASLQAYVPHEGDASEVGCSSFPTSDVHRIGLLDIRLFNTDRHAGNILVVRDAGESVETAPGRAAAPAGASRPDSREDAEPGGEAVGRQPTTPDISDASGPAASAASQILGAPAPLADGRVSLPSPGTDDSASSPSPLADGRASPPYPFAGGRASPPYPLADDRASSPPPAGQAPAPRSPTRRPAAPVPVPAGHAAPSSPTYAFNRRRSATRLVPIDHGFALPESLEPPYFEWQHWPQAMLPFSREELAYIARLDADADVALLRRELPSIREESLRLLQVATGLLQRCAGAGLSLAEIAGVVARPLVGLDDEPSDLERLCLLARGDVERARDKSWGLVPSVSRASPTWRGLRTRAALRAAASQGSSRLARGSSSNEGGSAAGESSNEGDCSSGDGRGPRDGSTADGPASGRAAADGRPPSPGDVPPPPRPPSPPRPDERRADAAASPLGLPEGLEAVLEERTDDSSPPPSDDAAARAAPRRPLPGGRLAAATSPGATSAPSLASSPGRASDGDDEDEDEDALCAAISLGSRPHTPFAFAGGADRPTACDASAPGPARAAPPPFDDIGDDSDEEELCAAILGSPSPRTTRASSLAASGASRLSPSPSASLAPQSRQASDRLAARTPSLRVGAPSPPTATAGTPPLEQAGRLDDVLFFAFDDESRSDLRGRSAGAPGGADGSPTPPEAALAPSADAASPPASPPPARSPSSAKPAAAAAAPLGATPPRQALGSWLPRLSPGRARSLGAADRAKGDLGRSAAPAARRHAPPGRDPQAGPPPSPQLSFAGLLARRDREAPAPGSSFGRAALAVRRRESGRGAGFALGGARSGFAGFHSSVRAAGISLHGPRAAAAAAAGRGRGGSPHGSPRGQPGGAHARSPGEPGLGIDGPATPVARRRPRTARKAAPVHLTPPIVTSRAPGGLGDAASVFSGLDDKEWRSFLDAFARRVDRALEAGDWRRSGPGGRSQPAPGTSCPRF